VLEHNVNGILPSAIAGITGWSHSFLLLPRTIEAPQVVGFLENLFRPIRGEVPDVWDDLPAHRGRLVKNLVRAHEDRLVVERLPGHAPELNPVENRWGYRGAPRPSEPLSGRSRSARQPRASGAKPEAPTSAPGRCLLKASGAF